jgi:hypothetical protein
MACGTTNVKSRTEQQAKSALLKEPRPYPAVIQLVVVESQLDRNIALYRDYDPTYLYSTDHMSPLWRIG